jgi:hypothetical protein
MREGPFAFLPLAAGEQRMLSTGHIVLPPLSLPPGRYVIEITEGSCTPNDGGSSDPETTTSHE